MADFSINQNKQPSASSSGIQKVSWLDSLLPAPAQQAVQDQRLAQQYYDQGLQYRTEFLKLELSAHSPMTVLRKPAFLLEYRNAYNEAEKMGYLKQFCDGIETASNTIVTAYNRQAQANGDTRRMTIDKPRNATSKPVVQ